MSSRVRLSLQPLQVVDSEESDIIHWFDRVNTFIGKAKAMDGACPGRIVMRTIDAECETECAHAQVSF